MASRPARAACSPLDCGEDAVTSAYKKLGNVIEARVDIEREVLGTLNKYVAPATAKPRIAIRNVELSLVLGCASTSNLISALASEPAEQLAPSSYVQDFCASRLKAGDFLALKNLKVVKDSVSITLKDNEGEVLGSLTPEQFVVLDSGVELLEDISPNGLSTVRVLYSYDPSGIYQLEALTSEAFKYKSVYFKGTNHNGALFDALFHKVLFAPVGALDIISVGEFTTLTLSGSVEMDAGKHFKLIRQGSTDGADNDIWY